MTENRDYPERIYACRIGHSHIWFTDANEYERAHSCEYVRADVARALSARATEIVRGFVEKMDPACLVETDAKESHLADNLREALALLEKTSDGWDKSGTHTSEDWK